MSKKCEFCGRFMTLTDLLPEEDEFDEVLAYECGLTEDKLDDALGDIEGKWSRFNYVQDQWECENCQVTYWHTEGPRYYWNPKSGNYDGPKPKTPKVRAREQQERQKAAGQMDMFE